MTLELAATMASPSTKPETGFDSPEKHLLATWRFPEWSPDHIHFEGELILRFFSDGEVWAFAGHLAHHNRNWGPMAFYFTYHLYDRVGTRIHIGDIHLATLGWRQEANNVQRSAHDHRIPSIAHLLDWSKSLAGPRRAGA